MALNSPEARDLAHHLHSFTHLPSLERDGPLVLERGEGIYVHDTHGKRYLESVSGLWNVVVGFQRAQAGAGGPGGDGKQMPAYHTFFGRTARAAGRARREAGGDRADGRGAGLLRELGVRGQRHHHQDAVDDGAGRGRAGAAQAHLALHGLSRHHRRVLQSERQALHQRIRSAAAGGALCRGAAPLAQRASRRERRSLFRPPWRRELESADRGRGSRRPSPDSSPSP